MPEVIQEPMTVEDFKTVLAVNTGLVVIRFTAEWCRPCQSVHPHVERWYSVLPDNVQPIVVDIDESLELYSFLKNKKMLAGIPAILMYTRGNTSPIFDDAVNTSDVAQIDAFFDRVITAASKL